MEEGKLVFPLWLYNAFRRELCPDFCPFEPPVCAESVLLLIEGKIRVPPLKEGHDHFCKTDEKFKLRGKVTAFDDMPDIAPYIDRL